MAAPLFGTRFTIFLSFSTQFLQIPTHRPPHGPCWITSSQIYFRRSQRWHWVLLQSAPSSTFHTAHYKSFSSQPFCDSSTPNFLGSNHEKSTFPGKYLRKEEKHVCRFKPGALKRAGCRSTPHYQYVLGVGLLLMAHKSETVFLSIQGFPHSFLVIRKTPCFFHCISELFLEVREQVSYAMFVHSTGLDCLPPPIQI